MAYEDPGEALWRAIELQRHVLHRLRSDVEALAHADPRLAAALRPFPTVADYALAGLDEIEHEARHADADAVRYVGSIVERSGHNEIAEAYLAQPPGETPHELKKRNGSGQEALSTLAKLFEAGLVFHPEGSRTARDLLLAQEHLGDALDALDALPEDTDERDEQAKNIHALLSEVGVLATRDYVSALVEVKHVSIPIETFYHEGWSFNVSTRDPDRTNEVRLVDTTNAELVRQRQELVLLSAFVAHADNKAEQQRLICLDKDKVEAEDKDCEKGVDPRTRPVCAEIAAHSIAEDACLAHVQRVSGGVVIHVDAGLFGKAGERELYFVDDKGSLKAGGVLAIRISVQRQ